jgi:acyl-CoA reductase-like NAD-dependent aldehyde dehydrogenase
MDAMLIEPTHAASLCGAIHSPDTLDGVGRAAQSGRVLRASGPYPHPEFPQARTATPLLLEVDASSEAYRREVFGPVAYLVEVDTREQAVEYATRDAAARGSIASYVYSTDPIFLDETRDAFALAGASLGCNLIGQLPINFTAAFSDYHVTGLNPAGNACLTDLAFVTHRFRIVQSKTEVRGSL